MLTLEVKMNQAQQQLPGTTMMYNAAGQPAVAITLTPQTSPYQLYESKQSKITGIILIGVGVLSIVFNAVGMVLRETWTMRGYGYGSAVMVSKIVSFFTKLFLDIFSLLLIKVVNS